MILEDVVVSLIGKAGNLTQQVALLGGTTAEVSDNLPVVTSETGRLSCVLMLKNHGIPIVPPQSIARCWRTWKKQRVHDLWLPCFANWRLTSTDLVPAVAHEVRDAIVAHGGY
jgi:hypothetical protein